ncbi:MAG TPA: sigma-70 family RNA polymerase sigma factor, partial [Rubrivivax sp.]|nr:sigma-70 family RNA polymerase sigma factor [Rubrivivax sp.]
AALGTQAPTPEWELWRGACAGDATHAATLVRRLTPQAYGLAMQILARREDAEDAVQESFLRLWGSRPSDAMGATLATYFNTIVINRCKTRLRQRHEFSAAPDELVELADAQQHELHSEGGSASDGADGARIQQAMARLAPRQRMALAMWAYADADVADIARAMELEVNAAHQLLHRAKAALRLQLQESAR